MNIKGEIGQIVYIPVTIREIKIDTFGTRYVCDLPKDAISQTYEESEIRFLEENIQVHEEKEQKVKEKVQKSRVSEQKESKKRGRPRKANVDDLMKAANKKKEIDIPSSALEALEESKKNGRG